VALAALRARFDISFVGTEPAVKPAAAATRSGRIGVMATSATVRSGSIERLAERHAANVEVVPFACPDRLVELVEQATIDGAEIESIIRPIGDQTRARAVDVMGLGCTHDSFLRRTVERMLGPEVTVLDTGLPVARQALRILEREGALAGRERAGSVQYLASSDPESVAAVARKLLSAACY
jgi:glutamate racemase